MDPAFAVLDIRINHDSRTPAFRQIAQQIARGIADGDLGQGFRLPPSRTLAARLGIARNSIVDAYAELAASGLLESRGRHGSFVQVPRPTVDRARAAQTYRLPRVLSRLASGPDRESLPPRIDLRPGNVYTETLPLRAWRAACREAGRHLPPSGYGDPRGDAGLREAISGWLRRQRATEVAPEDIVVTPGAGQAIELIAAALVRPGDVCALEDPGYPRAARAFRAAGGRLSGIPVDADGALTSALRGAEPAPALIHLTPAHQYPLGGRLSGRRRRTLLDTLRTSDSLVIENEYDHEFVHAGLALPPLFKTAPDRVILVGTFAKAISPALRLGFIAAHGPAARQLATIVERDRLHVSWPVQKTVEYLIGSGELERHLRRVRRRYAALRQCIRARLEVLGDTAAIAGDTGGLHLVLRFDSPRVLADLVRHLSCDGIVAQTLQNYAITRKAEPALLLGYGHLDEAALETALASIVRFVHGGDSARYCE